MEKINKAIQLAVQEYKNEFGQDAQLEDGDEFATVFNDGVLILSFENGKLSIKILAGKPYLIDYDLNLTE